MEPQQRALWAQYWNDPSPDREAVLADALLECDHPAGALMAIDRAIAEQPGNERLRCVRAAIEARWLSAERAKPQGWLGDASWSAFRQAGWQLELRGGVPWGAWIGPSRADGSRARAVRGLLSHYCELPLHWLAIDARRSGGVDDVMPTIAELRGHPLRSLVVGRASRVGRPTVFRVPDPVGVAEQLPCLERLSLTTAAPVPDRPRTQLKSPRTLDRLRLGGTSVVVMQSLLSLGRAGLRPRRVELRLAGSADPIGDPRWPEVAGLRPQSLEVHGRVGLVVVDALLRHGDLLEEVTLGEPSPQALLMLSGCPGLPRLKGLRLGSLHAGHRLKSRLRLRFGGRLQWM